jgi:hypothetical protein
MTQPGRDNPYLAHLPPSQRGVRVPLDPIAKEPLHGFMPRKVTGPQVLKAMVCFSLFEFFEFSAEALIQRMVISTLSQNNHTRLNIRKFLNREKSCPFSTKWKNLWIS